MAKFSTAFFTACLLFLGFSQPLSAQAPQSLTSADMYLGLRKLNVLGSVLYIAAHPDDENTRLITYLSKDKLYRTGYLSLTRGDGGQNLIGDEQGIELGLIRTQELLSARRIDGGEQFFSRAYDFGYSKTPEETFSKWDKEKILSDVVWVIRKFQPDVIITRFPTTGEGGHGHHTASAILANEAFTAAADASRFPEQLKYVSTWQAKRILWNTFNFGTVNTISADQFRIDVGGFNPLLGKSYGEIAAESRSQHKSQGFGVPASRGEAFESFKTTGGKAPVNDLMDGVEMSWKKTPGGDNIARIIDSLSTGFDFLHPEKSVKGLVHLFNSINALPASNWTRQKSRETKMLIQQCSGLFIDITSAEQFAVQRDSISVDFTFNDRLGLPVTLKEIHLAQSFTDAGYHELLPVNKNYSIRKSILVREDMPVSQPYWLINKMKEGYYDVNSQEMIGVPDASTGYQAGVTVNIEGTDFEFTSPVRYKFTDPVRGELYQPLVVLPAVLVEPDEPLKLAVNSDLFEGSLGFSTRMKNPVLTINSIHLDTKNVKDTYTPGQFSLDKNNSKQETTYKVEDKTGGDHQFYITDIAGSNSLNKNNGLPLYHEFAGQRLREIHYAHIPFIAYFQPAAVKTVKLDLKIYNKKVAYITGAGDKVPEALTRMGYDVTVLSDKELAHTSLSQFDAIITGVRAHNVNEWMNGYYNKLMNYVKDGGNLIVQYNTSSNIGPVRAKIGPYAFDISRNRVTDENAAIKVLQPEHPVMNFPNKISPADFDGWIQERSIYHASNWDKKNFETILAMKDPGEKEDEGSLIIAKYGKGYFTYTGLVFFRELPAGVPGAYRLMANLIALNRKKGF